MINDLFSLHTPNTFHNPIQITKITSIKRLRNHITKRRLFIFQHKNKPLHHHLMFEAHLIATWRIFV